MRNRGGIGKVWGCLAVACATSCALAGLAGCGGQAATPPATTDATVSTAATTVPQDHTVTFSALFFEVWGEEDDPEEFLEERGYTDVAAADDGSYTATVPADDYDELVSETLDKTTAIIRGIPDDDAYPDAVAVDYDEQFATVTVSFSTDTLDAEDSLASYTAGEAAVVYQQIAGLPVGCDVILVGPDGSELANTMFPMEEAAAAVE